MNAAPITATLLGGLSLSVAIYCTWLALRAALRVGSFGEVVSYRDDGSRHDLLDRKAAILEDIHDLGFEHRAGKLSDADFEETDARLRAEAREILRALDESVAPYRAEAEELVKSRVGRASLSPGAARPSDPADPADPEGPPEASDAVSVLPDRVCPACTVGNPPDAEVCGSCGARLAPIDCASCQTMNDADATFCKKCGTSLGAAEAPE